jgi:hypothetical protein
LARKDYAWFEVWVEDVSMPPYVLILLSDREATSLDIYDPVEKVVRHSVNSYQDARFWLLEDEYTKVDGRMVID